MDAWGKKHARELHQQGTVTALAFNDPKRLEEVLQPVAEASGDGERQDGFVDWNSEE